jgi:hypothetical protein
MRATALLVAIGLVLAVEAGAQPAPPDVNDAEFKCMRAAAKGEAKFAVAKTKCIYKCLALYWKGLFPDPNDCFPPYGGATLTCIQDATFLRGAENRFEAYMLKYCHSGSGADCPECYAGGDCATATPDRVQNVGGVIDSFIPGLVCETAGAEPLEQRCQLQTLRAFGKYYGAAVKCYTACVTRARADGTPFEDCFPAAHGVPVEEGRAHGCLTSSRAKASATIHKYCHETSEPERAPECGPDPYPDGDFWVNLIDIAIEGVFLPTFCSN